MFLDSVDPSLRCLEYLGSICLIYRQTLSQVGRQNKQKCATFKCNSLHVPTSADNISKAFPTIERSTFCLLSTHLQHLQLPPANSGLEKRQIFCRKRTVLNKSLSHCSVLTITNSSFFQFKINKCALRGFFMSQFSILFYCNFFLYIVIFPSFAHLSQKL